MKSSFIVHSEILNCMKTLSQNSYTVQYFKRNDERTGSVNHYKRYEWISKINDFAQIYLQDTSVDTYVYSI